ARGKQSLQPVVESISSGAPTCLVELRRLHQTLKKGAVDVLTFGPGGDLKQPDRCAERQAGTSARVSAPVFCLWRIHGVLQTLTYTVLGPKDFPLEDSSSEAKTRISLRSRGSPERQSSLSHTQPSRATFKLTEQG